ncbi:MAG: PaaI family thioesterase [Haliea sp.]|nr:MAG: PaaI family thioesterase [Haliea sp.]
MNPQHILVHLIHRWSPGTMYDIVRKQLSRTVPFAKLLGLVVEELDAQGASASVEPAAHLNNHVGTLHAGVIYTACEAASGAALAGALLPTIMKTRFVVRDARIAYLKPAKGRLVTQGRLARSAEEVLAELQREGRADIVVEVDARVEDGFTAPLRVAQASFTWNLRMQAE